MAPIGGFTKDAYGCLPRVGFKSHQQTTNTVVLASIVPMCGNLIGGHAIAHVVGYVASGLAL